MAAISKRGGKREGAGRKRNPAKDLHLGPEVAGRVLNALEHEKELVKIYQKCGDNRLKLQILFKCMEYKYGRPPESMEVSGKVDLDVGARLEHASALLAHLAQRAGEKRA